ncbi:MAG: precorrin-2 C(20)-methyltransferase [Clostridia bacterium]|nr:precorrin-2 C(20)-methyltransferase [Clostridia bacterium]
MAEHKHDHAHEHHGHTHSHSHEHNHAAYVSNLPIFHKTEIGKGTFYGVSVGPGDCGHLTLNAVQTIMHCPVITAPQTKSGAMVTWDIAKAGIGRFLELSFGSRMAEASDESFWAAKTILPLNFPMTKVESVKKASHRNAAEAIEGCLDKGLDVAMLNLGDVSVYATCQYVADLLKADGYETKFIPGVTSFCAAASALGTSLTEADTPVFIVPGAADSEQINRLLDEYGTKVLMKTVRTLPETLEALKEKGFADSTSVVVNCGMPGEQLYSNLLEFETALLEAPESTYSYFTVLIVKPAEETT